MKKLSLAIALGCLSVLAACKKDNNPVIVPAPILKSKTITFEVFRVSDYTDPDSKNGSVQIKFGISRINKQNNKEVSISVLDTIIPMPDLHNLPINNNKLSIQKTIPDVNDDEEYIRAGYSVKFMNGYVSFEAFGAPVDKSELNKTITVNL